LLEAVLPVQDRTRGYLVDADYRRSRSTLSTFGLSVFMPEHVHLLICPHKEAYSVAAILQAIKQPASRRATIYLREHNPEDRLDGYGPDANALPLRQGRAATTAT
jgi:hypothetical protein